MSEGPKIVKAKDKAGQLVGSMRVVRSTDAARLMNRIYSLVDHTLDELEDSDLDPAKKAAALGTLSKTVKEMADIEERRTGSAGGKSVKELTTEQLRELAAGIVKGTSDAE